jgi:hypothetical protein
MIRRPSELPGRKIPGAHPIGGCDVEDPHQKPRFKQSDKTCLPLPAESKDEIAKPLTAILFRSREDGLFRV